MEMAWFLTGLAHAQMALGQDVLGLENLAFETYRLLIDNQGPQGAFGHLAANKSVAAVFRGRVGSFADQVYPIYALTQFATAYGVQPALASAIRCAEAICKVQGPQGQWWWHYDASTGSVFQRYPVFAVHQDGMAPMALFTLGEAVGLDFSASIYKGLEWIVGNNELACDMRDTSAHLIWRSIHSRSRYKDHLYNVLRLVSAHSNGECSSSLTINFECRPYHLGWLLYAFAGRQAAVAGRPLASHVSRACER